MQNRRDLMFALPALAMLGPALATAQENASSDTAARLKAGSARLAHNTIFRFKDLPVHTSPNGSQSRAILMGTLPNGEGLEMHETMLTPGNAPHPPHRHIHAEMLLIREGKLSWIVNGKEETAGPGDILYAASNELHGVKNVGTTNANYFVVAIGPNINKGAM
jgi:quercetin dioxygenase-like cupin family protein